jgi:hypothetical protein
MFPYGEPESVIRWELEQDGDSDTIFTVTHSRLTKSIALRLAPGWRRILRYILSYGIEKGEAALMK